ncbi:MAG TPA: ribonuclease P protein component [Chitinophagaceae bacterium]|nr:ribonuclease P protein component [Chitinophagaceae bacterium]
MAKQFTLGKHERLKSRKSIEQLFSGGKKITAAPYRVFYILNTSVKEPSLLFGTGVSAKNFKKAVDRNRIKRLTREAYRLQKNPLQEKIRSNYVQLNVFFIYTGKELPEYDEVYKKTGDILKKLDKLVEQ